MKRWRRVLWIGLMIAALAWPLWHGVRELRQEQAHKALLLEVQEALQKYHVDEERYIPREMLNGSELISVLYDFGFLDPLPDNPWSGAVWTLDGAEPDRLLYRSDINYETYALQIVAARGSNVVMEIDSVSSTSLE